jgi:hypothetical protein
MVLKVATVTTTMWIILIALITIWILAVSPIVNCIADVLDSLPLTNHAKESHASESWNAATIKDYMTKRACTPSEYMCADNDTEIAYCEIKPGYSIGLVVGRTVRQIITGFAGPTNFWQSRCP